MSGQTREQISKALFKASKIRALPRAERPRCGAKTRAGGTCQAQGLLNIRGEPGRCRLHGGLSSGIKTAAGLQRHRAAALESITRRWAAAKAAGRNTLRNPARDADLPKPAATSEVRHSPKHDRIPKGVDTAPAAPAAGIFPDFPSLDMNAAFVEVAKSLDLSSAIERTGPATSSGNRSLNSPQMHTATRDRRRPRHGQVAAGDTPDSAVAAAADGVYEIDITALPLIDDVGWPPKRTELRLPRRNRQRQEASGPATTFRRGAELEKARAEADAICQEYLARGGTMTYSAENNRILREITRDRRGDE